jgi:CheY-like chemotaxis protein
MTTQSILYVEDDQSCREAISQVLEAYFDCKVDLAVNGIEGVEKALANDYAVIIMDIGLPDIDGVEAARRIKKWNANQPIVSSSGHAMLPEDTPADAFDTNFRKPFASQLKEFKEFCASVGVELVDLN